MTLICMRFLASDSRLNRRTRIFAIVEFYRKSWEIDYKREVYPKVQETMYVNENNTSGEIVLEENNHKSLEYVKLSMNQDNVKQGMSTT